MSKPRPLKGSGDTNRSGNPRALKGSGDTQRAGDPRPLKGSGDTKKSANPRPTKKPDVHPGHALNRFGINPDDGATPENQQKMMELMGAIVTNPHLLIGAKNSLIDFPAPLVGMPPHIPVQIIPSFHVYDIRTVASVTSCLVKVGWVQARDPYLGADAIPVPILPTIDGTAMKTTRKIIEVGKTLYCRVETNSDDLASSATIVSETPTPASTHAQPAQQSIDMAETVAAVPGVYYYPIADFEEIGGRVRVANQYQSGGPIMHVPGRNGHASSIHFVDCDGGSLAFLNIRQGLETTNLGYKEIECGCDGGTTSSPPP